MSPSDASPIAVRVLLADDHALVRAGIRSLLENIGGFEVVGEAATGSEAIQRVDTLAPDLLLIDIAMPEVNGLKATAIIKSRHPALGVLMLSMHTDREYVTEALRAGASGYLIKDAAPVELELALRAVVSGQTWLSPQVSTQVIADYVAGLSATPGAQASSLTSTAPEGDGTAPASVLTPRQLEILIRIARGQSAKEIAFDLQISTKTVEAHRTQLMDRLNIHDVSGLTRYAIRSGLISADA